MSGPSTEGPRWPPEGRIALAVSGGSDSMGMLALAVGDIPDRITVITVDHALRADSAADAAHVAATCADMGIACHVRRLDWSDGPPSANVQARARAARYDVMQSVCEAERIPLLATAHHADDQAETLLMRLARGSGPAGLSGIREARPLGEVTLIRPCLRMRRTHLAEAARAAGIGIREDPSNADKTYDRTRVRALIAREDGLDPGRLAASAAHLAAANEALEWTAGLAFESRTRESPPGTLTVDARGLPQDLRRRLMLRAFAALGAPEPRSADLLAFINALESGGKATLSGLIGTGGPKWTLLRE